LRGDEAHGFTHVSTELHLNERKAARHSGFVMLHDVHRTAHTNFAEQVAKLGFGNFSREIADEKARTHDFTPQASDGGKIPSAPELGGTSQCRAGFHQAR
jgi:hypothetical protein